MREYMSRCGFCIMLFVRSPLSRMLMWYVKRFAARFPMRVTYLLTQPNQNSHSYIAFRCIWVVFCVFKKHAAVGRSLHGGSSARITQVDRVASEAPRWSPAERRDGDRRASRRRAVWSIARVRWRCRPLIIVNIWAYCWATRLPPPPPPPPPPPMLYNDLLCCVLVSGVQAESQKRKISDHHHGSSTPMRFALFIHAFPISPSCV